MRLTATFKQIIANNRLENIKLRVGGYVPSHP